MNEKRVDEKRRAALDKILKERTYQVERWGADETGKDPTDWLTIIVILLGKAAQELSVYQKEYNKEGFKKRLTQIGATCLAAAEQLD